MPMPGGARSITSIRLMAELGVAHGLPLRACLAGTGLGERDLSNPASMVTPEQELHLIQNLVMRLKSVPALGVEAGLRYHFTAFGMLGFAMAASPNIGSALEIALRYFNLTFALTTFHVTQTDADTLVTLDNQMVPGALRQFITERDSTALICVQRDLCPHRPILTRIQFSLPAPADITRYHTLLGLWPVFGAARSMITLNSSELQLKLPQANEEACRAAEEQCKALLDQRRHYASLSLRVRHVLLQNSAHMPDMATLAMDLGMTARTLRRRLDDENTTFSRIRDEVRRTLAEDLLLLTPLSIEQIATRLSYADPTCFINAFKGWKGTTPLSFRKQKEPQNKGYAKW